MGKLWPVPSYNFPSRDPDQVRRDVDRLITERMLGIRPPPETDDTAVDPACQI